MNIVKYNKQMRINTLFLYIHIKCITLNTLITIFFIFLCALLAKLDIAFDF